MLWCIMPILAKRLLLSEQDVVKDSILIVLMNSLFSIVSGLTVFSVLGFMAVQTNRCGAP